MRPTPMRTRAQLLVGTVALIVVLSGSLGLAELQRGHLALAAARLAFALGALPLAFAARRRPEAAWPYHVLLCGGLAAFLAVAWLTPGRDLLSLFWAALIPLLATMSFDRRRGLVYGVATLAGMALVLAASPAEAPFHRLEGRGDQLRVAAFTMVVGACVYFFDVDRRRALAIARRALADAQAERARRARFFAAMSHELRTPLNGVLGMIQVVLAEPIATEERRTLELARRSCESLAALIGDVVDETSRRPARGPGSAAVSAAPTTGRVVALRALAEDVTSLSRGVAERKGLALELHVADDVPRWVHADEVRLRQILHNLVGNALKFTARGHVAISIARADDAEAIRIVVEDTGIGIPADVLGTLFEPFRQAEVSTSRRFGGSGLGLAITRRTVEQLGGRLSVDSTPDVGSRFALTLPLARASSPPAADAVGAVDAVDAVETADATNPPDAARRRRVLCVDDNPVNLRVLELLLARSGLDVVTATSGRSAIARAEADRFDAILMDRHMPDGDGLEATRAIRALDEAYARVPIVAVTAAALPEELDACLAAGMDVALTKPLDRDTLLGTLHALWAREDAPASLPPRAEPPPPNPPASDEAPRPSQVKLSATFTPPPTVPSRPWAVRLVDGLIPARLLDDPIERTPARIVVVLSLALIALELPVAIAALVADVPWAFVDPGVLAGLPLLAVATLHLTRRPRRAYTGALVVGSALAAIVTATSPTLAVARVLWISLVPLAGTLVLGHRWSVRATGLALAAYAGGLWLRSLRGEPANPPAPSQALEDLWVLGYGAILNAAAVFFDFSRGQGLAEAEAGRAATLEAASARSRLLAHMTHELRTPMGGVVGLLELLVARAPLAPRREQLETAARAGRQLLDLVDDILDHARLEHGRLELEPLPTELEALRAALVEAARRRAGPRGVPVDGAEPRGRRAHRLIDGLRLARVVEKLVDDRVQRGARRIVVAVREDTLGTSGDDVVVEVCGLDAVGRELSGDRSRGAEAHDTGLGLTLARALVDAMGGQLSEPTPLVWRVQLTLPLAAAPAAQSQRSRRLPLASPEGGALVVDDNAVNRAVASSLVRRLGLTVTEAHDGLAALDAVEGARFAVLLLDHEMPGLDGIECARRLRAEPRHDALAILLVTASNEPAVARAAIEAGVDAVLVKPLTRAALEPSLRAAATDPAREPTSAAAPR